MSSSALRTIASLRTGHQSLAAAVLLALGMAAGNSAQADLITYTDRTAFQNALFSFTVDTLDGETWPGDDDAMPGFVNVPGTYVNPDYTMSSSTFNGCLLNLLPFFCTNPSSVLDGAVLEMFPEVDGGTYNFAFNNTIAGFGFDYESAYEIYDGTFTLAGQTVNSPVYGQRLFFGVIDTSGVLVNPVIASTLSTITLVDNITYGVLQSVQVPEPASLLLFSASLLGLAGFRRRS